MIGTETPDLAFQEFALQRPSPLILAPFDEKVAQGGDCPQTQIVFRTEKTAQIPDRSFQQRAGAGQFPGLPTRVGGLGE